MYRFLAIFFFLTQNRRKVFFFFSSETIVFVYQGHGLRHPSGCALEPNTTGKPFFFWGGGITRK